MLATIDFDNQHLRPAYQIGNIRPDGNLPAELVAAKLALVQVPPKAPFGLGRINA